MVIIDKEYTKPANLNKIQSFDDNSELVREDIVQYDIENRPAFNTISMN